jgi:hypothetical protein
MDRDTEYRPHKTDAVHERSAPIPSPIAKKLGRKRVKATAAEPVSADRYAELRRLVGEHKRLAGTIQRWESDIKSRTLNDGTVLPPVVRSLEGLADAQRAIKTLKADQKDLVKAMVAQLRGIPIYDAFLSKVYGIGGGVLAAYLVAMVRIEMCPNVSNLIRYCGNAPDFTTGKREIRRDSPKAIGGSFGTFNSDLRRNNYLIMTTMRKCAAKPTAKAPHGVTTKYLDRWHAASFSRRTMGRAKGADAAGRMKATDLLLWDLYVMWRTIEGLDIRHDKFTVSRGHDHAGNAVDRDTPFRLTLSEAREIVGKLGALPLGAKREWTDAALDDESAEKERVGEIMTGVHS